MTNLTSGIRLSDDWDDSGWVQVPRNILRDRSLTFKAMGLVAYLASHMAGFRINREFLYRASANGKDSVESGLKELRTAGYLTVERVRDGRGLLTTDTDYVLHRYPVGEGKDLRPENPDAGDSCVRVFPNQDNPESGKPATKGDSFLSETHKGRETQLADAAASAPEPAVDGLFEATTPTPVPASSKAKDAKTATKRGTTAPDALVITSAMREWATGEGITVNLEAETAQMLDHHQAKGSTFRDWTAAWRTWMRNSQKFASQRSGGHRPFRNGSVDYTAHGGFGEEYPDNPFSAAA
jgi:hypothetical protein